MAVFTCTCFKGHWPVGTAAVVIAEDREKAATLLNVELEKQGLSPEVLPDWLDELGTDACAVILCNGDY